MVILMEYLVQSKFFYFVDILIFALNDEENKVWLRSYWEKMRSIAVISNGLHDGK